MTEPSPTALRYPLLASLWTTQFVGVAFLTIGLTGVLRDGGTDLQTLALVQLLGLVWPLKFLWAPLVDRRGSARLGHHRSWLLVTQSGMALSLLALLPFSDPANWILPVLALSTLFVLFAATQDIAADALSVRLLGPHERGVVNGLQVGSGFAGTVLGGGACVVVYDTYGWTPAILLLSGLTAAALLVIARFREPARDQVVHTPTLGSLLSVLAQPGCRPWALGAVPLMYVSAAGVNALFSPALLDAGWSLARVGTVTGIITSVPALLAAVLAGVALRRFRLGIVLLAGLVAMGVAMLGLLPVMSGQDRTGLTVFSLCSFVAAYAVANVAVYTRNMDFARPGSEGTDITVLTSISMVVAFVAGALALAAAQAFGYPAVTVSCAVLAGIAGIAGFSTRADADLPPVTGAPPAADESDPDAREVIGVPS